MTRSQKMYLHIRQWETDDITQRDYCHREGISYVSFRYWRKHYLDQTRQESEAPAAPNFYPIEVDYTALDATQADHTSLEIVYPNGIVIRLAQANIPVIKLLLNIN